VKVRVIAPTRELDVDLATLERIATGEVLRQAKKHGKLFVDVGVLEWIESEVGSWK